MCRYGDLLVRQEKHEEAQDYYRMALKADPENRQNLERYAAFLATHNMDEALYYYQVREGGRGGEGSSGSVLVCYDRVMPCTRVDAG